MKQTIALLLILPTLLLAGCQSAYYGAMEKVGIHKRDILVDRIEEARETQQDSQQQFRDALEQFRSVVDFSGGELESQYNALKSEYDDSVAAAEEISERIESVEEVAAALFEEWESELDQISNSRLRNDSARKLRATKSQYRQLAAAMRSAESSVQPVLSNLRDLVFYLKHNLNARAIGELRNELRSVDTDVNALINSMQSSIDEANRFIDNFTRD